MNHSASSSLSAAAARAGRSLTHPLALAAAVALLLNALLFQRLWPAWWTGKLGDLAWTILLPLFVAPLLLALLGRHGLTPPRAGWLALALTGLALAVVKTVPAANTLLVGALAGLGYGLKLAPDPTDLLALPGLALAGHIWQRSGHPAPTPRWLRAAGLGLAALALVADSAGAINQGVECVGTDGADLIAVTATTPDGYFSNYTVQVLRSTDGGLTWTVDAVDEVAERNLADGPRSRCTFPAWPLHDPAADDRFYAWVDGQGLYVTDDGGQTLTLDLPVSAGLPRRVTSGVFHSATGHLVLAAGPGGIAVRLPAGEWQLIEVPLGPGRIP